MLSGTLYIEKTSGANATINYPSGFNANNCVALSCGIKYSVKGFNYVGVYQDSMDMLLNAFKRTLTLTPDNIILRIDNPATDKGYTFNYKIVLLKIN